MDKLHILDTDKAQGLAQVGLLMIQTSAGVDTTAGGQDKGALALQQAFGALLAILEGHPGTQHMVEPGLEGAGDGEVVHGGGQHQHVGGQQFIGQGIGQRQGRTLGLALLLGRGHPAAEQVAIQMRHLVHGQITHLDLVARVGGLPVGDKLFGKLTGDRTLLTGAAFDNQDLGHAVCSIVGSNCRWAQLTNA